MKAFFKRRWFLLSCTLALIACTMLDLYRGISHSHYSAGYGIRTGYFAYYHRDVLSGEEGSGVQVLDAYMARDSFRFHPATFGRMPRITPTGSSHISIRIPLWIPLGTVLGWLCFRELRWREKRANEKEAA